MTLFTTFVADPPWPFKDHLPGPKRGSSKHYRLEPLDDICSFLSSHSLAPDGQVWDGDTPEDHLPIRERLAPGCRLFLWRVASMQEEALRVMRAWGFTPKTEIVWIKTTKGSDVPHDLDEPRPGDKLHFGMGRTVRMSHEVCLVGVRGKPRVLSHSVRSVFFAPFQRHSEKPEVFSEIVESLSPGPYLELFARRVRPGWTCVGDEVRPERRRGMVG